MLCYGNEANIATCLLLYFSETNSDIIGHAKQLS